MTVASVRSLKIMSKICYDLWRDKKNLDKENLIYINNIEIN